MNDQDARYRAARLRMAAEAANASAAIGRMLNMSGMLDPQERDTLETVQSVLGRFER